MLKHNGIREKKKKKQRIKMLIRLVTTNLINSKLIVKSMYY